MPIRFAVVDGQPLLRYGLRELIARHADIEIVAECQSAGARWLCSRPPGQML
jgi:DNA-binding NarL/FixJ family response regulator